MYKEKIIMLMRCMTERRHGDFRKEVQTSNGQMTELDGVGVMLLQKFLMSNFSRMYFGSIVRGSKAELCP